LQVRIAIVEDRLEDQKRLSSLLAEDSRRRGWTCTVEAFPNGEAFLAAGPFDIVFLDVVLSGIDGLETARRLRTNAGDALVVFVSVEADYAVEGYEVDAAAFLVKPARPDRFRRVMDRLARKLAKDATVALSPGKEIFAGSVLYATVTDHYLKVYAAGQIYSPNLSMGEFQARLPDDGRFLECSRGALVNLDHVAEVEPRTVALDDGTRLPVSRRRRQGLVDAMAARKFSKTRRDMA